MNKKRKVNKRKPTVRHVRSNTKIRRRRKPKEKVYLQVLVKALRLLIIFSISAFLVYILFKSDSKKKDTSPQPEVQTQVVDSLELEEEIIEEDTVNISALSKEEALHYSLDKIFKNYDIKKSWIRKKEKNIKVQLPADLSPLDVLIEIIEKIDELGLDYAKSKESLVNGNQSLTIVSKKDTLLDLILTVNKDILRETNKLAIIIDDFGYYNNNTIEQFINLEYAVTLSIIPGQKYSRELAKKARQKNKEVMLHLPMEAEQDDVEQNEYTILTSMSDENISARIKKALKAIPNPVAVNNHMGSKATADRRVMNVLLRELKKKGIIFIDSRTTSKSVAEEIARLHNLPFAKRTVFLDGSEERTENYVRNQLIKASKIAERKGSVIVIGHPHKETIAVLKNELPLLEKKGVEVVSVSELVK